jgi:hypothetical protein
MGSTKALISNFGATFSQMKTSTDGLVFIGKVGGKSTEQLRRFHLPFDLGRCFHRAGFLMSRADHKGGQFRSAFNWLSGALGN